MLSWHLVADGDGDLAAMSEFPDGMTNAASARLMAAYRSADALADLRTFWLASAEDFDTAPSAAEHTSSPPPID